MVTARAAKDQAMVAALVVSTRPKASRASPPSPASTRCWSWSWPAASTSCAARTSSRWATAAPATHVALALGLAACQKGFTVAFTTAAALVSQLLEARDERRLLKLQRDLASAKLLIIDELGYVPLSPTGAELLFETFSQRYERGSTIVTSNLPFEDWTSVLGSERLTGALLDRLTHHVSILTMNGDSYRLNPSLTLLSPFTVTNYRKTAKNRQSVPENSL